jgi:hypothetical protein
MSGKIDIAMVDDLEVDGADSKDYPDFCDAHFSGGNVGGVELTADELMELGEDYPEHLAEMAFESFL